MSAGGRIIEAGGELLHVVERGRPDGPALLLSMGMGGAWFDWDAVTGLLDGYRVICVDRPGLGLSPRGNTPPSLRREVRLLAGLAEWTGHPVTVVAQSMAGFHAEAVARIHPSLISGLVLVDPSNAAPPRLGLRLSGPLEPAYRLFGSALALTRLPWLAAPVARRIAMRYFTRRNPPVADDLVRSVYGRGTVIGALLTENTAYGEMAADLIALRERLPFPPIPLVVLTATGDVRTKGGALNWAEGHRKLAAMSPYGRHEILPDAYHLLQMDRPDKVAEAVDYVHSTEGAGA